MGDYKPLTTDAVKICRLTRRVASLQVVFSKSGPIKSLVKCHMRANVDFV
jgi:hypothetical protein